jgi:hypothetical protein
MKKFLFFAALLGFAVACGGNDSKKNENNEAPVAVQPVEKKAPEASLKVVDAPVVDVKSLEVSSVTITPVSATTDEKASFTAEKEFKSVDIEAKTFKDATNAKPAVRVDVQTTNTNLTVSDATFTAVEL